MEPRTIRKRAAGPSKTGVRMTDLPTNQGAVLEALWEQNGG